MADISILQVLDEAAITNQARKILYYQGYFFVLYRTWGKDGPCTIFVLSFDNVDTLAIAAYWTVDDRGAFFDMAISQSEGKLVITSATGAGNLHVYDISGSIEDYFIEDEATGDIIFTPTLIYTYIDSPADDQYVDDALICLFNHPDTGYTYAITQGTDGVSVFNISLSYAGCGRTAVSGAAIDGDQINLEGELIQDNRSQYWNYFYLACYGNNGHVSCIHVPNSSIAGIGEPTVIATRAGSGSSPYLLRRPIRLVQGRGGTRQNYLYVGCDYYTYLTILDITDPTITTLAVTASGQGNQYDFKYGISVNFLNPEYLYGLNRDQDKIVKYSLADPTAPVRVAVTSTADIDKSRQLFSWGDKLIVGQDGDILLADEITLAYLWPPSAPTLTASTVGNQILLTWTRPEHTQWYNLYAGSSTGVTQFTGTKIGPIYTQYYMFTPTLGTTYYFVVTANNESEDFGESVDSNEVNETISENVICPGELIMAEVYKNVTYRLNIAEDLYARAEQVRFWSQAEILRAINEGYLDFVRRTQCLQRFEIMPITSGTAEYSLPSDCIKVLWVGYDNKSLHGKSLDYMDTLDDDWLDRDGTPHYFVQELSGIKKLNLYETPETSGGASFTADTNHSEADADHGLLIGLTDDSTATTFTADSNHSEADADHGICAQATGDSVLFSGFTEAGLVTNIEQYDDNLILFIAYEPPLFESLADAETPHFMSVYHWAIVYFALSELFLKEGDVQNVPLANFYGMIYEDAVQNKLKTRHVANLHNRVSQGSITDSLPLGPHLPLDTYPLYRR